MKNLILSAIFILSSVFVAAQDKYNVQAGSKTKWTGYKLAKTDASSHYGSIPVSSGTINIKGGKLVGGTFTANVKGLTVEDLSGDSKTQLEGHLKTQDFFEVEKFPTATFTITKVTASKSKTYPYTVTGDLTIKGKKKSIKFNAKTTVKSGVATFETEKFTINRKDFGVEYDSTMKDVVIKNDVDLKVTITAKK